MPDSTKSIQTSIIVPCYNEKATIHILLDALYEQTYPRDAMEVVIADGMSNDGTLDAIQAGKTNTLTFR